MAARATKKATQTSQARASTKAAAGKAGKKAAAKKAPVKAVKAKAAKKSAKKPAAAKAVAPAASKASVDVTAHEMLLEQNAALKAELEQAQKRIAELEELNRNVVNRIDWVIDSLQGALKR